MNDTMVTFHGWVGGDVRHRKHKDVSVATIRVGVTPRIKRDGDWVDGDTVWYAVTAWRSLADHVDVSCTTRPSSRHGPISSRPDRNWLDASPGTRTTPNAAPPPSPPRGGTRHGPGPRYGPRARRGRRRWPPWGGPASGGGRDPVRPGAQRQQGQGEPCRRARLAHVEQGRRRRRASTAAGDGRPGGVGLDRGRQPQRGEHAEHGLGVVGEQRPVGYWVPSARAAQTRARLVMDLDPGTRTVGVQRPDDGVTVRGSGRSASAVSRGGRRGGLVRPPGTRGAARCGTARC